MKTVLEFDELRVPDYALPYLVNGDSSGLEAARAWGASDVPKADS